MSRRSLPPLHPAGIAAGALLTGLGVLLAESVFGPLLVKKLMPREEALIGSVHEALSEEYLIPLDREWIMHRAIEGMLDGLEDPYSFFIGGQRELRNLEEESSGNLIGIGAVVDGRGFLRYPRPGGPAEGAGLRPGDHFLTIDGEDVTGFGLRELTGLLKGKEGTEVHLGMERADGEPYFTTVVRKPMPTLTVRQVKMLDADSGIGTMYIRSFAHSTPGEVDAALDKLEAQGLRGLILDMRFNPGGMLDASVQVAARFLEGGVVTARFPRRGAIEPQLADPALGRAADLPVVVLLNGNSASGSEVVAGALRDRGAAVIVGERSYGKGVFQQVRRYHQGNFAVKFAAGYFLTPTGQVLEGHLDTDRPGGLEPDVRVPDPEEIDTELLLALRYEEPPEKYAEDVRRLFPRVAEFEWPADPARDAAVELLKATLSEI